MAQHPDGVLARVAGGGERPGEAELVAGGFHAEVGARREAIDLAYPFGVHAAGDVNHPDVRVEIPLGEGIGFVFVFAFIPSHNFYWGIYG